MSKKDKLFFVEFTIGCIIFIILVQFVFLKGTDKNSAFEKIVAENTGIENTEVFNTRNVEDIKLVAFLGPRSQIGYMSLKDNMRGSYECEGYEYIDGQNRVIDGTVEKDDSLGNNSSIMVGHASINGKSYTVIVSNNPQDIQADITSSSESDQKEVSDSIKIRAQSVYAYENPDFESYTQIMEFYDAGGNIIYETRS